MDQRRRKREMKIIMNCRLSVNINKSIISNRDCKDVASFRKSNRLMEKRSKLKKCK